MKAPHWPLPSQLTRRVSRSGEPGLMPRNRMFCTCDTSSEQTRMKQRCILHYGLARQRLRNKGAADLVGTVVVLPGQPGADRW